MYWSLSHTVISVVINCTCKVQFLKSVGDSVVGRGRSITQYTWFYSGEPALMTAM
jgi:hypothetical protein